MNELRVVVDWLLGCVSGRRRCAWGRTWDPARALSRIGGRIPRTLSPQEQDARGGVRTGGANRPIAAHCFRLMRKDPYQTRVWMRARRAAHRPIPRLEEMPSTL